jgi:hypothetical protein
MIRLKIFIFTNFLQVPCGTPGIASVSGDKQLSVLSRTRAIRETS